MSTEDYYCPLCGNKPYGAFVSCRILGQRICDECDDHLSRFFELEQEAQPDPPAVVQNLSDYSGMPLKECREIWHKEQLINELYSLRDAISWNDQDGSLWETSTLQNLLDQLQGVIEVGSFLKNH